MTFPPSRPEQRRGVSAPSPYDVRECVLDCVAEVPAGSVTTYGDVAAEARARCGGGSARRVGHIMASHGAQVSWWRVVNARGEPPAHLRSRAVELLRQEGAPIVPGTQRVDLRGSRHVFVLPP